jgi:SAM-dependent methyltransferase
MFGAQTVSPYYDSVGLEESSGWRDIAFSPQALGAVSRFLQAAAHRYLDDRAGLRWIDVGCGLGRTYLVARELGYRYTGIDSASVHVEHCRRQFPEGCFVCEDWHSHSGEYDLVTFISSLHHFRDWHAALERAFAVLSPGGVVVVDHEPTRFYARLFRAYSIRVRKVDPAVVGEVEIHWFGRPSILPSELPPGEVQYHFDYVPALGRLKLRTGWSPLGKWFQAYRKIMRKPLAKAEPAGSRSRGAGRARQLKGVLAIDSQHSAIGGPRSEFGVQSTDSWACRDQERGSV